MTFSETSRNEVFWRDFKVGRSSEVGSRLERALRVSMVLGLATLARRRTLCSVVGGSRMQCAFGLVWKARPDSSVRVSLLDAGAGEGGG